MGHIGYPKHSQVHADVIYVLIVADMQKTGAFRYFSVHSNRCTQSAELLDELLLVSLLLLCFHARLSLASQPRIPR